MKVLSPSTLLVTALLLTGCLIAAGCLRTPALREEGNGTPAGPVPPIVGSWISPARETGGAGELYLFRESGRADATAIPGAPNETLSYEAYFHGTWEETSEMRYLLAGEEIG